MIKSHLLTTTALTYYDSTQTIRRKDDAHVPNTTPEPYDEVFTNLTDDQLRRLRDRPLQWAEFRDQINAELGLEGRAPGELGERHRRPCDHDLDDV